MQTLIIHGRQPSLGRAELEAIYGADSLKPAGEQATIIDLEPRQINFMRLGGMVKFCKILTTLPANDWPDIEKFLLQAVPSHAKSLDEGKLKFGLSCYGLGVNPKQIQSTGIKLKKVLKSAGRSSRLVPNQTSELNAAQVLHNGLTRKLGWELVFVKNGSDTIIAQSIAVQDIDAYARRDQARPYRDARVGMLPPKLAQIIINLAIGKRDTEKEEIHIFDPFCGTGVILQEALLQGYSAMGADRDERMAEYTLKNLDWLSENFSCKGKLLSVNVADATSDQWINPFDSVASETYLGKAFSADPDPKLLQKVIEDVNQIHIKFLENLASQTKPGLRMCLAVPAWKTKNGFRHLPTLDKLNKLGYNRLSLESARDQDLIYHRPGQIVARELVILVRK